ncbi:hypothetical protein F5Y08DRAFT_340724 [Xylaria arbuscula]|nr:hypothetical protein F5Y08DRAFT_340724 [Xylaria arbuscula]
MAPVARNRYDPTMRFAYINGGPEGRYEEALAHQVPMNPDRLGKHYHHGRSTHFIVDGDLCVQKHHASDRGKYVLSDMGRRQDLVKPNIPYSATSQRGCTFVEAHEALSPQSAERFITRGTLRLEKNPGAGWEYPSNEDLKRWLISVEFNPEGKAHPNKNKGEKPILDDRNVYPPIPEEFLTAFSEWLEDEWRRPSWWERNAVAVIVIIVACFLVGFLVGFLNSDLISTLSGSMTAPRFHLCVV